MHACRRPVYCQCRPLRQEVEARYWWIKNTSKVPASCVLYCGCDPRGDAVQSHACAGSYFNRGKILGMLGRDSLAEAAYQEAARAAHGVAPGSYSKSLTALKEYGPNEVAALEDALLYLNLSAGATFSHLHSELMQHGLPHDRYSHDSSMLNVPGSCACSLTVLGVPGEM